MNFNGNVKTVRALPVNRVVWTTNIFLSVLELLSYQDLMAVAGSCVRARYVVKMVLQSRFTNVVERSMGTHFEAFCTLLRAMGGIITGSSVIWIMVAPVGWMPKDLNVITPKGAIDSVVQFLEVRGFHIRRFRQFRYSKVEFKYNVLSCIIMEHIRTGRIITLTESSSRSTFPVVLGALDTSLAMMATPDGVICFYPSLLMAGLRICCGDSRRGLARIETVERFGLSSISNTGNWDRRCGFCCPRLTRRVCGLRGAAYFDWGDETLVGGSRRMLEFASYGHYKWSLGKQCVNRHCPFYDM